MLTVCSYGGSFSHLWMEETKQEKASVHPGEKGSYGVSLSFFLPSKANRPGSYPNFTEWVSKRLKLGKAQEGQQPSGEIVQYSNKEQRTRLRLKRRERNGDPTKSTLLLDTPSQFYGWRHLSHHSCDCSTPLAWTTIIQIACPATVQCNSQARPAFAL